MTTSASSDRFLKYLGLPLDYTPSPEKSPVEFLSLHIRQLPEHLGLYFRDLISPQQRTKLAAIRNRRQRYTVSDQGRTELGFDQAQSRWPALLEIRLPRPGRLQGEEERSWADHQFLDGRKVEIGKLGGLLRDFEEEREAERIREQYRARAAYEASRPQIPEEDDDSDEEEDTAGDDDSPEQQRAGFERLIRERFIYGMLEVSCFVRRMVLWWP